MLKKIQQQFDASLFDKDFTLNTFVASENSAQRIDVYRQTVIENLRQALEITYPGIWQLLGKECADNIARLYCRRRVHLPKSGCLDDWGQDFSSIFDEIEVLRTLPYLKDYADYEWCKQLALCAEKKKAQSIEALKVFKTHDLERLRFTFHPSVHLMYSQYPLEAIEALMHNNDAPCVDLNQGESFAYIVRIDGEARTFWISKSEWTFYKTLMAGETLNDTCTKINIEPFDLTKILCFIFSTHSVISYPLEKVKEEGRSFLQGV